MGARCWQRQKTGHLGPTIFRSTDLGRSWKEAAHESRQLLSPIYFSYRLFFNATLPPLGAWCKNEQRPVSMAHLLVRTVD